MTDRELLELAAKAAGYHHRIYEDGEWLELRYGLKFALFVFDPESNDHGDYWNPLEDDGDALRLAVNLGIDIELFCDSVSANHFNFTNNQLFEWHADEYQAVRRAIVRVAAEIGRNIK
jgi:hypothetical protein